MSQDKKVPQGDVEQRSLAADIATVATPVAILAQPVVTAWAQNHFNKPSDTPPPSSPASDGSGSD